MTQKIKEIVVKRRLNLKNDVIFKTFFSRQGNEEFLIDFLNSLLNIEITNIKVKEEVNLEKLKDDEKGGRLDLQAELNDGIIVNIEMQLRNQHNIEERNIIYGAKTISRHFLKGEEYGNAKQVIMINILDYELFGFDEYVSETVTVLEKHRDYKVNNILKTYFIELPKFRKSNPNMDVKLNQWLAFIDDKDWGMIKMAEEKNETLKKARIQMNYLTGDEEVRRLAELREKWESDWNSSISYARNQGKAEGEKEQKIKTAKKLIKLGMNIDQIANITDLSKEEIQKL